MSQWTAERILALSPSAASSGKGLASPKGWSDLGRNDAAIWGACQGSGKDPYQVRIDPAEPPAFKCGCPAFRNAKGAACKHVIGLFLMSVQSPVALTGTTPPAWVAEWLADRNARAEKKVEKAEKAAAIAADPEAAAKAAAKADAQSAKSAARRAGNIDAGFAELELWLHDLVRQGLASAQTQPDSYWSTVAARMVDAQAPGAARLVRRMAGIPASGAGWQERLLDRLARLHLLVEGWKRLDRLPPAVQADIRATAGLTAKREELLATQPAASDRWLVLGRREDEEDNLRMLRTWLRGLDGGRDAVVFAYAWGNAPLDRSLTPGMTFRAGLAWHPGSVPLRAELKDREVVPSPDRAPGYATIREARAAAAAAWADNPWLEQFPMPLAGVVPVQEGEGWAFRDGEGRTVPADGRFTEGWTYAAASGGRPMWVFGEWDGRVLLPVALAGGGEG